MSLPIIDLEDISLGIIILRPSGVLYTNQTGGYACHHPEVEGVFAPLPAPKSTRNEIENYFVGKKWRGHCYDGIDPETADFLDRIFQDTYPLMFIRVDRTRIADSEEAWIYVEISEPDGDPGLNPIAGFGDCKAILTWPNSD